MTFDIIRSFFKSNKICDECARLYLECREYMLTATPKKSYRKNTKLYKKESDRKKNVWVFNKYCVLMVKSVYKKKVEAFQNLFTLSEH